MKKNKSFIILILISFGIVFQGWAQTKEKPAPPENHILFIFDASQSMYGNWESDRKINIARKYLTQLIDSLETVFIHI